MTDDTTWWPLPDNWAHQLHTDLTDHAAALENCRQAVAVVTSQADLDAWTAGMHAVPLRRRFVAREAGLYHFASGWQPHHETACTRQCPIRHPAQPTPRRHP